MIARVCGLIATMLASAAISAPEKMTPRQPTGKWVVDYARDQCLLSRAYSADEKRPLILTFEKIPMSTQVVLYLFKTTDRRDWNSGTAKIGNGLGTENGARFGAYTAAQSGIRKIAVEASEEVLNSVANSGHISLNVRGETNDTFVVPNLQAAFHALDDCALDLGRLWGVSVEDQKRIKVPAKLAKTADHYFNSSDYPDQALKKDQSGMVKVRVSVDAAGRPTNCVLSKSTGSKELDRAACPIFMQRVRFEPALDLNGRPMPSLYVTSIFWLLG